MRKDYSIASFHHKGLLSLEKLVVFQKNNSGNFHVLTVKTFGQADLEKIADDFMNKSKAQVKNRGNWSQEDCFHKYISYVTYKMTKID